MFDLRKRTVIKTDVLNQVLKSILSQSDKFRNLQLVTFYLQKFTKLELNYKIYNKKLLTIVKAFRQWKAYLEKLRDLIQIFTDYKNLIYFTIIKILNWWQIHWLEELSNFNFKIYYWKEFENAKTDVLSRRSNYMKNKF